MAIPVYVKNTGSDANDGLTPLTPKLTLGAADALATANGYEVEVMSDLTLTAIVASTAFSKTFKGYLGVEYTISGPYAIQGAGSNAVYRAKNLKFTNFSGTNGGTSVVTVGTNAYWSFENCTIDGTGFSASILPTGGTRQFVFKNSLIKSLYRGVTAINQATFFNTTFKDFQNNSTGCVVLGNSTASFIGCEFINCPRIIYNTALLYLSAIFSYCTFWAKDALGLNNKGYFITHNNAANLDDMNMSINNCIFSNIDIIQNTGAGALSINGSLVFNNFIHSGTVTTTGYTSFSGDVVNADPQFYDTSIFDFRLEATSPAAKENNLIDDNMGANELAHPSNFFTSIPENKVETAYAYKQLSRVNNKTGSLSAGYPLLPANKVEDGYDRGDGTFGTNKGEAFNTVLTAGIIQSGQTITNLGNIINGTDKGENFNSILNPANLVLDYTVQNLGNTVVGTSESTDPGVANVTNGTTYKIYSILKTGTRTAIYSLLPAYNVESGIDRGDGSFGTNKGENFNTVINLSKLQSGYNITNLGNSVTGTDKGELFNDVLSASILKSGNTVLNLGNSIVGTDKGESFNTALTANKLQSGYTVQNLGNSVTGTDKGESFNDALDATKLQIGYTVQNLGNTVVGTNAGGGDYPIPAHVLKDIVYGNGAYEGTLGAINGVDLDIVNQMVNSANIFIQNQLGSGWQPLKYFKEVEQNSFRNNATQWGIRALGDSITKEKIGKDTLDIEFEIKLTTDFSNRQGDDHERSQEQALITQMEGIRRMLRDTKFFKIDNVRDVRSVSRAEVEKLGNSVLLCKSTIVVNIDIKNT